MAGDLNLIVDIPDYGPTEYLPDNFHYIGPIVWEPEMESPGWLETLDSKRPTLYFTMGSTGHTRFFEQAIEIFGNTNYQCIMTIAGMAAIDHIPNNFYVVDYAPGSKILEKSDLVVCQEWNLDRVESLGIGIHLSDLKFKPAHLTETVEKILSEKSYNENAFKYKNILKEYNWPGKGAQLIDSYLKKI